MFLGAAHIPTALVAEGVSPEVVVPRVVALSKEFSAAGLTMVRQDEDELAAVVNSETCS